jgi:chromosome segregation ATPase
MSAPRCAPYACQTLDAAPQYSARSGKIEEGDRIVSVDGQSCADTPVSQAREMIVGIQGTTVRIAFLKPQGDHYQCLLTRGTAEYLEQVSSASTSQLQVSRTEALLKSANLTLERLQRSAPTQPSPVSPREEEGSSKVRGENEKLRLRNTELEMEVSNLQSVVVRLQQQIDFERGSAKSVSHEVELIQKKYSDQIRDLHNMLNESEKARRDAELQLSLQQKRESAVHDAVQKAKEQAEQREQYYTDLCNKLEEERNDYESLCNQEKLARICSGTPAPVPKLNSAACRNLVVFCNLLSFTCLQRMKGARPSRR